MGEQLTVEGRRAGCAQLMREPGAKTTDLVGEEGGEKETRLAPQTMGRPYRRRLAERRRGRRGARLPIGAWRTPRDAQAGEEQRG
jgi:hypothetical protein